METIGVFFVKNRLKDLREDKDLTQSVVAKIINISQTNYSKYELGKINIPIETLVKLADFYNTSIDYLIGRTNNNVPYTDIKSRK